MPNVGVRVFQLEFHNFRPRRWGKAVCRWGIWESPDTDGRGAGEDALAAGRSRTATGGNSFASMTDNALLVGTGFLLQELRIYLAILQIPQRQCGPIWLPPCGDREVPTRRLEKGFCHGHTH